MGDVGAITDAESDAGYPAEWPADPVFPRKTLDPVCPVLEGVALPSTWSRLRAPLERALRQLWQVSGLSDRGRPQAWISLQAGRIAVNAHGWERLAAALRGDEPDPALVGPPASGWELVGARLERLRVRRWRKRLRARLEQAHRRADSVLERVESVDVKALETPPLARGPFDELSWTELLLPWLAARALEDDSDLGASVERGLRSEQRFVSEVGRRLVHAGVLHNRADVAYLTVEERIQAAVQASGDGNELWTRVVDARAQRVDEYAEVEVPQSFWGQPRTAPGQDPGPEPSEP